MHGFQQQDVIRGLGFLDSEQSAWFTPTLPKWAQTEETRSTKRHMWPHQESRSGSCFWSAPRLFPVLHILFRTHSMTAGAWQIKLTVLRNDSVAVCSRSPRPHQGEAESFYSALRFWSVTMGQPI